MLPAEKQGVFFLFDAPLVEGFCILGSVLQMFRVGLGKVMSAGEVFLGTHVEVVVLHEVQYGIDSLDGGNLDRAGGQSFVKIGVVGALGPEQFVVDSLEPEVFQGELDGGVRL